MGFACITNIPFNIHKSFHTEVEAWTYLSSFYPHVHSPDDISFMNENCPKEASNLTNPSPRVREVSGLAFSSHRNINEFFYFDDLPDTITTKRLAATTRMLNLGLHPSDDYTFLPITHTITSPSSPTTTPTTTTTSPPFSLPPPPPPPVATITPTSALPHTCPTPPEADCDMMSLADSSQALLSSHNGDGYHTGLDNQDDDLSSRASSQLCFSPPTPQTTNHKRARPESAQTSVCSTTPTLLQYFLLVCDLSLPLSSIHRSLQIGLADHGLPTTSISPPLLSCAVQSPSQSTSKLIYIQIMDTSLTAHIIRIDV